MSAPVHMAQEVGKMLGRSCLLLGQMPTEPIDCKMSDLSEREAMANMILELLNKRKLGVSICPSDAARAVFEYEVWRSKMEVTREAAVWLAQVGKVEITQKGRRVDPADFRGPIRIRLRQPTGSV